MEDATVELLEANLLMQMRNYDLLLAILYSSDPTKAKQIDKLHTEGGLLMPPLTLADADDSAEG